MANFVDVVTGNATVATNVNQLVDALNGSVASQVTLLSTNNSTTPLFLHLPSAPTSDLTVAQADVAGDGFARMSHYVRGADGYGGIRGGKGTSFTAHLYAQSGGWKIDEALTVVGAVSAGSLAVTGAGPYALVTPSGVTIYIGPASNPPAAPKKWDVWLKTPFS